MRAFHNDPKLKDKYVARVKEHVTADEIIHGVYWEDGKGCAVGCTIHGRDHRLYETELGIPRVLALLEDRIFEGMGNGDSKEFPLRFISAIDPGADLSLVWPKFANWLLLDPTDGVIKFAKTDKARRAIRAVADLHSRAARGLQVKDEEWKRARNAAAYAYDAYAYADAYDAYADAYDAYAAYAYAYDAYAASASAATRQNAYKRQADKLIELLQGVKP